MKHHKTLEELQELIFEDNYQIVAVDLDTWVLDPNYILEVGISISLSSPTAEFVQQDFDIYIIENMDKNNHHRSMSRSKYDFLFGHSNWCSLRETCYFLQDLLNQDRVILVGHGIIGARLSVLQRYLHLSPSLIIVDTQILWKQLKGPVISLDALLQMLDITRKSGNTWHHAGNDAHYIMTAFLQLSQCYISF